MVHRVAIDENEGHGSYQDYKERGAIGIGWSALVDVSILQGQTRPKIQIQLERIGDLKYPPPDGERWFASHRNQIGRIFNQFLNDIKVSWRFSR